MLHRFLNDEHAQNNQLPESYRSEIQGGLDCDEISGASGEFGRSFQNPVPVNGPVGEILYLSNLRMKDRTPIMFHRIGSKNGADAFETVSLDGKVWDVLFLHPISPEKISASTHRVQHRTGEGAASFVLGNERVRRWFPSAYSGRGERCIPAMGWNSDANSRAEARA